MKLGFLILPLLSCLALAPAPACARDGVDPVPVYVGRVDPAAFAPRPLEHEKLGVTVDPAVVRLITPGVDKYSIYNLIGTPHFGEGITRRWNYVLFFPATPGSTERVRCRMNIRFEKPPRHYSVVVSEVIWQDQACADRVAQAN